MATISSLGVGSGIDLKGILKDLMLEEQKPMLVLKQKEAVIQARITALGSLKGALSGLQAMAERFIPVAEQSTTEKYVSYRANVTDTAVASASASTGAIAGSYSLEVTALAQNQRLASQQNAAYTSSSSALASSGTLRIAIGKMGTGSFVETSGKEIAVTAGQTLGELRDAINASNAGVSATIVTTNTAGGARAQLVLTSNTPGLDNVAKLTGLAGFNFDPEATTPTVDTLSQETADGGQAAQNAMFKLNGVVGSSSTNTVNGLIDGVTLNLLKTNVGTPTTLTVSKDSTTALKSAVNTFIKSYNDAVKTMGELSAYDAATKTAAILQGDATLRGSQSQMRGLLSGQYGDNPDYKTLSSIGIQIQKDGTLQLNSTRFDAAVAANYEGVTNLLASAGSAFKTGLDGLVGKSGNIAAATDSAKQLIDGLGQRAVFLEDRLNSIEARYRKQFTALDNLVAGLNQTSTYLAQQLANLPGFTRKK